MMVYTKSIYLYLSYEHYQAQFVIRRVKGSFPFLCIQVIKPVNLERKQLCREQYIQAIYSLRC